MAFDDLPIKNLDGVTAFEKITPKDIRAKIENPKDDIHRQIKRAARLVCSNNAYVHDHSFIEDLAQEVSLKVWQHTDSFDSSRASLEVWIYEIAKNHFLDYLRRSKSKKRDVRKNDELTESSNSKKLRSHFSLTEKEIVRHLDNQTFLDSLRGEITPYEFELLEMKFREGLNFKEMAERLNLNKTGKGMSAHFYRLLQKIRKIKKIERKN